MKPLIPCSLLSILLTPFCTHGATAQAPQTADWSRLSAGISIGRMGGAHLWSVDAQPILSDDTARPPAVFNMVRRTQVGVPVALHLAYFQSPHVGFVAELDYLGLATQDDCTLVIDDGDPFLEAACAALKNTASGAGAVSGQVGVMLRPIVRSSVQPHLQLLVGMTAVPNSTVETISSYGDQSFTIYRDQWSRNRPTGSVDLGIATAPAQGFSVRLDARATMISLGVVDAATSGQEQIPPKSSKWILLPTLSLGFDIVFKKSRGTRY